MEKIGYIYKITSPKGRVYIGSTNNKKRREKEYRLGQNKNQTRINRSIKKYGWSKHVFEIVEEVDISQMKIRERYYQEYFDVLSEKGMNCLLVNTDEKPLILSESTRRKISKAQIGKKPNENQRRALDEGREYVKLHQYDLEGNLIKVWDTVKSAITENSFDISSHLYGKKSHAGGFIWLTESDIDLLDKKIDTYHYKQSSKDKYKRSDSQIKAAISNIVSYNKSRKGKSKLDKFKNDIIKDYNTYSIGYLAKKYECTIQTMIPYLKKLGVYEFRKNYQKLI